MVDGQVTPTLLVVSKINLGAQQHSLVIDGADQPHKKPSPTNRLLLPQAPCPEILETAAGAPGLARRDHSRIAAKLGEEQSPRS